MTITLAGILRARMHACWLAQNALLPSHMVLVGPVLQVAMTSLTYLLWGPLDKPTTCLLSPTMGSE